MTPLLLLSSKSCVNVGSGTNRTCERSCLLMGLEQGLRAFTLGLTQHVMDGNIPEEQKLRSHHLGKRRENPTAIGCHDC